MHLSFFFLNHSPWEIVDPYPVLVNHNAGGHHANKNLCVALILKTARGRISEELQV